MSATEADAYVRRIRNARKRAYAVAYLAWLRAGQRGDDPTPDPALSYMAAQGVRLHLAGMAR